MPLEQEQLNIITNLSEDILLNYTLIIPNCTEQFPSIVLLYYFVPVYNKVFVRSIC